MKQKTILLLILSLILSQIAFVQNCIADDDSEETSESRYVAWSSRVEPYDHLNSLALSQFIFGDLSITGVTYQRMLSPHLAVGLSYANGRTKIDEKEGGDLAADQYYRRALAARGTMQAIHLKYYLYENGHRKSGFYAKFSFGQLNGEHEYSTNRYGPDNGLIIIGDGKRLLESAANKADFKNQYTMISAGAQISMIAHRLPAKRLNLIVEFGAAPSTTASEASLAGINDTKKVDSKDLTKTSGLLSVEIPF